MKQRTELLQFTKREAQTLQRYYQLVDQALINLPEQELKATKLWLRLFRLHKRVQEILI